MILFDVFNNQVWENVILPAGVVITILALAFLVICVCFMGIVWEIRNNRDKTLGEIAPSINKLLIAIAVSVGICVIIGIACILIIV